MLSEREKHNLEQIKGLNQRGGRMLSLVDLLDAGTVNEDIAAFLLFSQAVNLSFLTAANPGGTGKTTLMAAMLNFLQPGIRIKTMASLTDPVEIGKSGFRFLVHELGDGPYYSYLWGSEARNFFLLGGNNNSLSSCIHADTLEELQDIVYNPPLEVSAGDFKKIDLLIFMVKKGDFFSVTRRVSEIYAKFNIDKGFKKIFSWQPAEDEFSENNYQQYLKQLAGKLEMPLNQLQEKTGLCKEFLRKQQQNRNNLLEDLREDFLIFYQENF